MSGLESLAYPNLVGPVLIAIRDLGGSATIEEIEDGVAKALNLSDEILSLPHARGSRTEFQYRLAWVRTYLKKVGALENSEKAVWTLTEYGERMTPDQARRVFQRVNAESRALRRANALAQDNADIELEDEDDDGGESWVDQLLDVLGKITPAAFERLSQRLLRESGFTKVEVTGRSGDGGVDGIGVLRMNLVSFQVLFQSKRWQGSVGPSVVRDFRGAMVGRADKGIIITTSTFTAEARREATRDGAPAIDLIDGEALCVLLKERKLGVGVRIVEEMDIDPKFFESI
ncbi:MAG TPA: restriction endonuclease [Caulobacterales bacterium]|nr:restriction endonuclease [Caulobacterales bacterium]